MRRALVVTTELLRSIQRSPTVTIPPDLGNAHVIGRMGAKISNLEHALKEAVHAAACEVQGHTAVCWDSQRPKVQVRVLADRVVAVTAPLASEEAAGWLAKLEGETARRAACSRVHQAVHLAMEQAIKEHLRGAKAAKDFGVLMELSQALPDDEKDACAGWERERDWTKGQRDAKRAKDSRCRIRAAQHKHASERRAVCARLRRGRRQGGACQRVPGVLSRACGGPPAIPTTSGVLACRQMVNEAREDLALLR